MLAATEAALFARNDLQLGAAAADSSGLPAGGRTMGDEPC